MHRAIFVFLLVFTAFGQTRGHMADYALLLADAPVAQASHSRLALQSAEAQARLHGDELAVVAGDDPVLREAALVVDLGVRLRDDVVLLFPGGLEERRRPPHGGLLVGLLQPLVRLFQLLGLGDLALAPARSE